MNENTIKVKATSKDVKVNIASKDNVVSTNNEATFNQRKFISDIYVCEQQKYILEQRIKNINKNIGIYLNLPKIENTVYQKNYDKNKKIYKAKKAPEGIEYNLFYNFFIFGILGIIGCIGYSIYLSKSNDSHPFINSLLNIIPIMLIVAVVGLALYPIIKAILDRIDSKDRAQYWKNEDKIKAEINEYNEILMAQETAKYNDYIRELKNKSDIIVSNLTKERQAAHTELERTNNTLEMLYNLRLDGVLCLHPNYQGLVTISIIYGYFDTGRCTQLQGHEGAYNLYEDEKMKGMIINKLDIVTQQLGKLNTAMIYVTKAIESCNESLSYMEKSSNKLIESVKNMHDGISNQMYDLSDQMASVESNTANGAYYAEVGAKMTTFNTVYNMLKN